jgi:uracil-DNA glycosylase family 4
MTTLPTLPVTPGKNLACRRCPLRTDSNFPVVGTGSHLTRLMVVGDRPGEDEDLLMRPFEDLAGMLLRKLMRSAGLDPDKAWLCYTSRCFTKDRGAAARSVATCKTWLWEEMQALRPKVVVTLGRGPTALLLGLKASARLEDRVGRFHEVAYLPGSVVAPWHGPARLVQRGRETERLTVAFFESIKERLGQC